MPDDTLAMQLTTLDTFTLNLRGEERVFHVVEIPGDFRAEHHEDWLVGRCVTLDGRPVRVTSIERTLEAWQPGAFRPKKVGIAVKDVQ